MINQQTVSQSPGVARHPFLDILTTRYKVRPVRKLLEEGGAKRSLLDVGCGSGFMLSQLESSFGKTVGIDLAKESIEFGRQFTNAALMVGDAEAMPFGEGEFDCIVSTDAFEHIPDDKKAIAEVHRVLKKGGVAVLYVPSLCGLLSHTEAAHLYHDDHDNHMVDHRYYTKESLSALVESVGLKVEYVGFHDVFFQEFFTQALKWVATKMGKKYEHQAHITTFTESSLFGVYRTLALPLITLLVRTEEFICENLLGGKVPGHRVILKCRKV